MPTALGRAVERVRSAVRPDDDTAPDGRLLARYLADRDGEAFAALVRRHATVVYATCRRVTGDCHLADDAFQATFLVLARRAADVQPADAVGRFLYGVARRSALEARTLARRRLKRERPSARLPDRGVEPAGWSDVPGVLDEELRRLPAKYRDLLVECDLLGRSRADAAKLFRLCDGTLSSRLAAARKMLAGRLLKRGVSLSLVLATPAAAAPPGVVGPAARFGSAAGGTVPPAAAALAARVLRAMTISQFLRTAAGFLLVTVLLTAGVTLTPAADDPKPKVAAQAAKPAGPGRLVFTKEPGELTLADPDGGNVAPLKRKELYAHEARLSPDGKRVAFLEPVTGNPPDGRNAQPSKLYVRDVGGPEPDADLGQYAQTIAWSPDGKQLAVTDFDDGPPEKVKAGPESYLITVATKEKVALKLPAGHIVTDWSRDGKRLVTTSKLVGGGDKPDLGVYLVNPDGSDPKRVTDPAGLYLFGRLSPDGSRVLCSRLTLPEKRGTDPKMELVVVAVASGKATPVADVPEGSEVNPNVCWSPDGKRIAYCWRPQPTKDEETGYEAFVVACDPDGKNPKTVATVRGERQHAVTLEGVDWR